MKRCLQAFVVLMFLCGAVHAQMRCDGPPNPKLAAFPRVPINDDWFQVYQLPGNVYALWEPRQAERVYSYLIVGEKRALLFDSGLGIGHIERVVAQLTKLPVTVLNSHTHEDHMGGNYAFDDVRAVDTPYTREHAAKGYDNAKMAESVSPAESCAPLPEGVSPATFTIKPFHIAKTLHDGEVFDLGGRTLEVLLTPGHTPDSICLLDRAQRTLYTGDTYYPGSLWLWAPETDLDAYQHSIERIAALAPQIDTLRPAHGFLQADPAVLAKVAATMPDIRSGKIPFTVRNNRRVYRGDGFTVTMANVDPAPAAKPHQ